MKGAELGYSCTLTLKKPPRDSGQPKKTQGKGLEWLRHQSSQKESEINKMEGMGWRKCNNCRAMVDKIPQEATARNKGFLEGWWFLKKMRTTRVKRKNSSCVKKRQEEAPP